MGRRALSASAALAFIVLAVGLTPWSWGVDGVGRDLGRQVEAATGLRLAPGRRATLTLLPVPAVTMHRPRLSDRGGRPLLQARVMRAELSVSSLLVGRIAPIEVTIVDAVADAASARSRHAWARAAARAGRTAAGRSPLMLSVANGGVAFASEHDSIRSLALTVAWPRADGVVDVSASGRWRGEAFASRFEGSQPAALASNARSPVSLALDVGGSRLSLQGRFEGGKEPAFRGHASLATPDFGALGVLLGAEAAVGALRREVRLEGEAELTPSRLSAASARLSIGGDLLDGSLALDLLAERPTITGTLATETISLPSPLALLALPQATGGGQRSVPLPFSRLTGFDFDVRLSASEVEIGDGRLQDVALSASLKNGRLEATLGRASAYKGTLRGRATLQAGQGGAEMRAQGSVEGVEFGALLPDLLGMRRLAGTGGGQIAIEASGSTVQGLAGSLAGRVAMTIRRGEIVGVDFGDAARRFERRRAGVLDAGVPGAAEGRTPFDDGIVNLTIVNGEARIAEAWFAGPALRLSLGGQVSIAQRRFQLAGAVATGRDAASLLDGGWPFEITGLFDDPRVGERPGPERRARQGDVLPN